MKGTLLSILSILIFWCLRSNGQTKVDTISNHVSSYEEVSLVCLLANSEKYDGKPVRIIGFLNLDWESDALYLHKEDYLASIYLNGLWVHVNQLKLKNAAECNRKYVAVEGIFDAKDHGHENLWAGALRDVTSLVLWHQPNEKQ